MEVVKEIKNQETLPIFCRESFLRSRSDNYGWFTEGDKILPFIIDEKLFFKRLIFTNCIYSEHVISVQDEEVFLYKVIELAKSLKVDFISKPQSNVFFSCSLNNIDNVKWGSYQKSIFGMNEDDLIQSFPSKTRNMVRKGIKENLTVLPATISELQDILSHTFKRQKQDALIPSLEYLTRLESNISSNFLLLKCVKDSEIQAVVGIPYDSEVGYYLYGGSIPRPATGAMNLLQFEAMKFLISKGVKSYDFVGARIVSSKESKYYGIQKFKRSFNPELKQGYVFRMIYNPVKFKLFEFMVSVFYFLKGGKYEGDPIDQILKEEKHAK